MAKTKKWKELKREVVYHKYSQKIERRDYLMPDGKVVDYFINLEVPGACVLAITPDNKIVTIPQYRPGPGSILRELPGGAINTGEEPRQAALRELLEETGYSGEVEDWTGIWWMDAFAEVNNAVIIVKNCKKVAEPKLESTEFGEVGLVDIPEFISQVRAGQLTDTAGAMLALDHLGLLS